MTYGLHLSRPDVRADIHILSADRDAGRVAANAEIGRQVGTGHPALACEVREGIGKPQITRVFAGAIVDEEVAPLLVRLNADHHEPIRWKWKIRFGL